MKVKRTILRISAILGTLVLLGSITVFVLINSAPFQQWLVGKATNYLSEQLHTPVKIDKIRFKLLHTLSIEGLLIGDQKKDTLLYVASLDANLQELDLDKNLLVINKVTLTKANVALKKYPGIRGINLDYILDFFASSDTTHNPNRKIFTLQVNKLALKDSRFSYFDLRFNRKEKGFDESYIDLYHLNIDADNFRLIDDSMLFHINQFSAVDQCGFKIDKCTADATISAKELGFRNLHIVTPYSDLSDEFIMSYDHWRDFNEFNDDVIMSGSFSKSKVNLKDIAFFAPQLEGYDLLLNIAGNVRGPLSNLKGKHLMMTFGQHSIFDGDLSMRGLPNIDETFIDLKANRVQTVESDLYLLLKKIKLPRNFAQLGTTSFTGKFTGFINDFVAYGTLKSELGTVQSDINLKLADDMAASEYSGNLSLNNFDIGALLNEEKLLRKVTLNGEVKGKGLTLKSVNAVLKTNVQKLELYNYPYTGINVSGHIQNSFFTGAIACNDPNLIFDFNGSVDLRPVEHIYKFNLNLEHANLLALHLDTQKTILRTKAFMDARADKKFQRVNGSLNLTDAFILRKDSLYPVGNLTVTSSRKDNQSHLTVNSSMVDLDITGVYSFNDLPNSVYNLLHLQAPDFFNKPRQNVPEQHCDFSVKLKTSYPVCNLYLPDLYFNNGNLKGSFSSKSSRLQVQGYIDSASYQIYHASKLFVNIIKAGSPDMNYEVKAALITSDNSLKIPQLSTSGNLRNNILKNRIQFNDTALKNTVDVSSNVSFGKTNTLVSVQSSKIVIRQKPFILKDNGTINLTDSGIVFDGVELTEENQVLKIQGIYSKKENQNLSVDIKDLKLDLISYFLNDSNSQFNGIANGKAVFKTLNGTPVVLGNIKVKDASYLNDTIGDIIINSTFESTSSRLLLDIKADGKTVKNMFVKGSIGMSGQNDLDLDIHFDFVNVDLFEEHLEVIFSGMTGNVKKGNFTLTGTLKQPVLEGRLMMDTLAVQVDYLKTIYFLTAEIESKENLFILKKFNLLDGRAKTCETNGWMTHDYFDDFKYSFDFKKLKDFWVLNTKLKDNELFFGTGYANGSVNISGNFNQANIDANLKSAPGTKVFLPLNTAEVAEESDFVRFINYKDWKVQRKTAVFKPKSSALTMNFNLDLTPDAEVQLIFNSQTGDIIKGRGKANLKMELNKQNDFLMYGTYTIVEGDYLYTALNVFNKKFVMKPGGTILWNGDPLKAQINMTAIYSVKTPLYPMVSGDEAFKSRIFNVECKLTLKGLLFPQPEIVFDIDFPDLNVLGGAQSVSVLSAVQQIKNNPDQLQMQFFSLLITKSFMRTDNASSNYTGAGKSAGTQSLSEFASNQLSNMLSQIDPNWEINLNYRANDANSAQTQQAIVSVIHRFLNGRLEVQTSTDIYRAEAVNFQAKYNINEDGSLKLKAFNTNTSNPVYSQSVITQGMGLYYTRQFNKLSDLKRKGKKSKAKKEATPVNQQSDDSPYLETPQGQPPGKMLPPAKED
ncbi:MAG: translocation/assembly module TamB [Bacteroidia bacterium]|nr:translocation/assembly module TamB [Bacteroidia bacterium]